MRVGHVLLAFAALSGLISTVFMARILTYLRSRGVKINWLILRLQWFNCMIKYRELTLAEFGETGSLIKGYTFFSLAALVLVIAGALLMNT